MMIQLDQTAFRIRLMERAIERNLDVGRHAKNDEECIQVLKKHAFYMIKLVALEGKINRHPFEELELIVNILKYFTYKEFMGIFPIEKEFDGWKTRSKDYVSTMVYLSDKDLDGTITEPFDFLWEYWNKTTMAFLFKLTQVMDDVRREQTGLGIWDEFFFSGMGGNQYEN